ncbi:MAG: hypothetical protein CMH54_13845 [Myxococcales bacterium]|nr:hypothetical protein [Myxococcales bacterium]
MLSLTTGISSSQAETPSIDPFEWTEEVQSTPAEPDTASTDFGVAADTVTESSASDDSSGCITTVRTKKSNPWPVFILLGGLVLVRHQLDKSRQR